MLGELVTEKMCESCKREIDYEEEMVTVNENSYLCNTDCLVDFLQTHGLVGLPQGRV